MGWEERGLTWRVGEVVRERSDDSRYGRWVVVGSLPNGEVRVVQVEAPPWRRVEGRSLVRVVAGEALLPCGRPPEEG